MFSAHFYKDVNDNSKKIPSVLVQPLTNVLWMICVNANLSIENSLDKTVVFNASALYFILGELHSWFFNC